MQVVFTTCPDAGSARALSGTLVAERLVACGNIVPGLTSVYRWKGEIREDREVLLILKTRAERLDALTDRLSELHPYDVPELLALPVDRGAEPYLRWVVEETEGAP